MLIVYPACYPAGTWRLHNIVSTSMQRHDVASTLRRRCIDVMCLLGKRYSKYGNRNLKLQVFNMMKMDSLQTYLQMISSLWMNFINNLLFIVPLVTMPVVSSQAGTWRFYNVALTSMQRHDVFYNVALTSMQGHDVFYNVALTSIQSWHFLKHHINADDVNLSVSWHSGCQSDG